MRIIGAAALSTLALMGVAGAAPPEQTVRARSLGGVFEGTPGPLNAITDVPGVIVGQTTVISGEGEHAVRTGVTAILPRRELGYYPAATFVLNGDAEMSGAIFAEEFGMLRSPIMLTGTASNGTVFTGVIKWSLTRKDSDPVYMPVVADTWDAELSDAFSFPLTDAHVRAALDDAKSGPVAEGNVGGGTGMICYQFKGGIGTASRKVEIGGTTYTVGVLVQCNQGKRIALIVNGIAVGKQIGDLLPVYAQVVEPEAEGSILIVVATDAPLGATTLKALAKRATLGLAKTGGSANPSSGDVVIAFSTARLGHDEKTDKVQAEPVLFQYAVSPLYTAAIYATEEAIINSMVAARTMTGRKGVKVHALPHDRLRALLAR